MPGFPNFRRVRCPEENTPVPALHLLADRSECPRGAGGRGAVASGGWLVLGRGVRACGRYRVRPAGWLASRGRVRLNRCGWRSAAQGQGSQSRVSGMTYLVVMDMDMDDLNRRMIGLLTLVYNTRPKLEDPEIDDGPVFDEFGAALDSLMAGFAFDYTLNFDLPSAEDTAHVWQVLQDELPDQAKNHLRAILMIFSGIFIKLSYALEDKYPDINIPGLLQEIGLDAADG